MRLVAGGTPRPRGSLGGRRTARERQYREERPSSPGERKNGHRRDNYIINYEQLVVMNTVTIPVAEIGPLR